MKKRFLLLQLRPEDSTADNEMQKICDYGGLSADCVERIRVEKRGIPALNLENYCAIIVGGSPFDVSTPELSKSAQQKRVEADFARLLKEVVDQDFPFLGCCSGNGLLGSVMGANISTQFGEAVACIDIELTEEGSRDPLLAGFPPTFAVLTGHKEACDGLPPSCVLLATNASCPVQMFRVGENVYATQFHPEGDPEGFGVRIDVYKNHGYFPASEAEALRARLADADTPFAHELLRRFVSRYGG